MRAVSGQTLILGAGVVAMLLLALTIAPLALGAATIWFAWRLVSFATAKTVLADVVDWRHEREPGHPSASIAYARMHFTDAGGRERLVTSTVGVPTDLSVSSLDPLPDGPIRLRYRTHPFLALEDDPAIWLTGPTILLAAALLGTMLKLLFHFSPLAWILGN